MELSIKSINDLFIDVINGLVFIEEASLKNGALKAYTVSEIHTVDAIGLFNRPTMSNTAKKLNVTVGTLTTGINNLVKKGIVNRYKDDKDRRIVLIGLSKKGRVLFRVHEKFHKDLFKEIISDLTKEELELFYRMLSKINNKLVLFEKNI